MLSLYQSSNNKNANGVEVATVVLSLEPTSYDSTIRSFRDRNKFQLGGVDAIVSAPNARVEVRKGWAYYSGNSPATIPGSDQRRRFVVINGVEGAPSLKQWQILHTSNHYKSADLSAVKAAIDSIKPGELAGPVGLTFDKWKTDEQLPNDMAGPLDDADGDGRKNALEFYLGSKGNIADGEALALTPASDGRLTITFPEAKGRLGASIALESSPDLAAWKELTLAESDFARTDSGERNLVTVKLDAKALGAEPARFVRLKVTLKP